MPLFNLKDNPASFLKNIIEIISKKRKKIVNIQFIVGIGTLVTCVLRQHCSFLYRS